MKEKLRQLHSDTLVRNSLYLLLSTVVMAGFGFVFWLLCARLFSPSQIGVATTLISAMTLISYISLLGFNSTFIRILPHSKDKSRDINTGLLLSNATAIVVAAAYVLAIPYIAPKLGLVHQNFLYAAGFVLMVALAATNLLTDSIFIAFRAAKYNLLIDGFIMSITKLALPFLFVSLGAYGIFVASGAAASVAMIASVFFLIVKFGYRPTLRIHMPTLKSVVRFSLANYVANLLNIAPMFILPLVVLNRLGSATAGYYYLTFMIATLLYTVIYAVTQSLFAEGSYAERRLGVLLKRSLTIIAAILVPSCIVLFFGAHLLLGVYGSAYSHNAADFLRLLAVAAPLVTLYSTVIVVLRIMKYNVALILTNLVYVVTIGCLAVLWVGHGLTGIGYAWLFGNLAAGLFGAACLLPLKKSKDSPKTSPA